VGLERQTLSLLLIHFVCYSLHHHHHAALNEQSAVTTLTDTADFITQYLLQSPQPVSVLIWYSAVTTGGREANKPQ
jgi:hypothetical protein